jgi:hypothetical protein
MADASSDDEVEIGIEAAIENKFQSGMLSGGFCIDMS